MGNEPVVVVRQYELSRWVLARVAQYPRGFRFSLGDRTINTCLSILEHLVEATYSRSKRSQLERANLDLEKLRFLVRLAKDEQCLSLGQYEYASRELTEIGRQVGGWRKQVEH